MRFEGKPEAVQEITRIKWFEKTPEAVREKNLKWFRKKPEAVRDKT